VREVGSVAIVTAASRGIGAATARRLARDGYHLGLLARSDAVCGLAHELGGIARQGSVINADDLKRVVDATLDKWGHIDAVVCNTGATARGDILSISDEDWHAGLDIALLHAIRLARLVAPAMSARGTGAIVNVSSFAAIEPSQKFPVSSVVRAGLSAFTKLFVEEYAGFGVRMNNVLPGFINNWRQPEEIIGRIPTGRQGYLDEVAATIAFLLSPSAAYINGQNILVDGGLVRSI
jgi:NAD(P)-dependent dehydrogenase (short-subunit alcohol dehydrogenase family)